MEDPVDISAKETQETATRGEREAAATATQLGLLLDAASAAIDAEVTRAERLEQKGRNQMTLTAALYAGGQALVVGVVGASLKRAAGPAAWPDYLAVLGAVATVATAFAFVLSMWNWRLLTERAFDLEKIGGDSYMSAAVAGKVIVGVRLVEHYAFIASERRRTNEVRVRGLRRATYACSASMLCVVVEVVVAFLAVAPN